MTHNRELTKRCLTLIILLHAICLIIWAGSWVFALCMLFVAAAGAIEICLCSGKGGLKTVLMVVTAASLFFVLKLFGVPPIALFTISLIPGALLLIPGIPRVHASIEGAALVFSLVVPCAVALSNLFDLSPSHVIALLFLIQFNDAWAYLAGKRFGKTKLAFLNTISPNKTLEGYAAGSVATLVAAIVLHTIIPAYPLEGILVRIAAQVVTIFIFGNAGDLAFSSIKRRMGVKDFSGILAGHGGIMDRFDSILFLSPAYLLLTGILI